MFEMYFPILPRILDFIFSSGAYQILQWGQSLRAKRCDTTIFKLDTMRRGSIQRLMRRWIVLTVEFAWIVENTRCPVIEASIARCAVSASRISHTMMMSGSCLSRLRSPSAKLNPICGLICVWFTQRIRYSTGSSRVDMFFSSGSKVEIME